MPNVKADLAETPDVVLWLVGDQYLPNKQVQLLALSSRRGLSFFQPHVSAAELITHIHNANYKEILRIIKENPTLILTHIDFTFPDGHTEKISPLKYAIKILDTAVLDACLSHLPTEYLSKFIQQAKQQVTYINFSDLFNAYQEFFSTYDQCEQGELDEGCLEEAYLTLGLNQRKYIPIYLIKLMVNNSNWHFSPPDALSVTTAKELPNAYLVNYIKNCKQKAYILPYAANRGLGYEYAFLNIGIPHYSGVISEGLATDGSYGTAMKGLFELQIKYLQSFHTQAQTRLAQLIQKAEAQQMRQDNREFNF